jgi:DnaK suppressor protein
VPKPKPYTKRDSKPYKDGLLAIRARLRGDVSAMAAGALRKNSESNGDLSSMPIHMADIGSDAWEQENTLSLMAAEEGTLELVEEALERIEEGAYGICTECGSRIPKARLNAIPYAPFCIRCASSLERH